MQTVEKYKRLKSQRPQYGDAEMLQPLLDQIDEPIASVTADGAYDTVNCYDAILKRQANVIIPPRSNAALWAENEIGKARNHAVQGCWERGQKQWKRDIGVIIDYLE